MSVKLTVVVVEEDRDRAIGIVDALTASGDCDVHIIGHSSGLARKIASHRPDIVLIDIDSPTRDMVEELTLASGPLDRPVAMFVSVSADGLAQAAVEAGVSAYVVDGLSPKRLKPVMDTAIARFSMVRQMRNELAETRRALEERKVIDRAKGLLMKARGIDEDAAYALLRKSAMDKGRRVADVAEALVTASGLLGMKTVSLPVAYMPLVDAAPLIIAQEMGFAEAEGIALDLIAAPSWSSVRDMLAFGRVDAAHMLSPVPVAMAMGLGGVSTALSAVSVLSMNGNVIGVGCGLEAKLRGIGYAFDFVDPVRAAEALVKVHDGPLRFGVPFPFSMHVELLRYWNAGTVLGARGIEIRTVPPPLMASALAAGDVDAFCVGEPWGSVSVEQGEGALLLPGQSIWQFSPEKVLAVRTDWADTEPDLVARLMRAVFRAGRWLSRPESRSAAGEVLSRPLYLDVPSELIDRALSGNLILSERGEMRRVERFVEFFDGAATFPWRSQAKWIATRLASEHGRDLVGQLDRISHVFRADLHRRHLATTSSDLPGASEKVEGAIRHDTPVASAQGNLSLLPDTFFDGRIFDLSGDF